MPLANYHQTNFLGGEWSPFFQGRTDHPKYRSAMNLSRNGFPLEEGVWVRRPGSRLKGPTYKNLAGRTYKVAFRSDFPYDVEFTNEDTTGWLRFWSGNNLVKTTDGAQAVTSISSATPAVMLMTSAVTWITGDEISFTIGTHSDGSLPLRQRTFIVTKSDTTHFTLHDGLTGANIDGSTLAITSGSTITASRILRVATPYIDGRWAVSRIVQNQDFALVLNAQYLPYMLTITPDVDTPGTADVTFAPVAFLDGPYLDPVPNSQMTVSDGTVSSITAWDNSTAYPIGSIVSDGGTVYQFNGFSTSSSDGSSSDIHTVSTIGTTPGTSGSGWEAISASAALVNVTGIVTLTASFVAWDASVTYNIGDYVSHSGSAYRSLLEGNNNQTPGSAPLYWVVVASGTEVTGADPTVAAGFQTTDVGRLIRLFATPPAWNSAATYTLGDVVTYKGSTYKNTGGNTSGSVGGAPDGGALINNQGVVGAGNASLSTIWTVVTGYQVWTWGVILVVTTPVVVSVAIQGPPLPLYSTSTSATPTASALNPWRLGVYSDTTTYPSCGSFYEGRFWFGGALRNRFDTSQSLGFDKNGTINMAPTLTDGTVTDACGISYVLESKDANEIVWFEPDHNGITAGTSGGEWLIQASTLSDPITPTSIQAKRVTKYCCANIEPRRTGISLTFVQKYRRRLMELLSDVFTNRYIAPHLNETAKHLSKDGIAELGYQEELAPIIWARTGDLPATGLTTTSQTVNDCTFDPDFTNQLLTLSNGDLTVDGTTTPPTVCALGIAIDFDAKKLWIYSPFYGGWNAQSLETQDPNTPVGGMTFTTTGTLFPMVYPGNASGTQNHVYTANFGATSFVHPIPTGYTAWGSGTTWNPSDKAANVTLSGGNLTAADLVANTNAGVRATTGKSTGKFYFEIAIVQVATWYTAIGFGTTAETLLDFPGRTGAGVHGFSVTCAAPPYGGGTYGLGGSIVNWNFLLTTTNENGTRRIAMATLGHNSGKFYFEMTMDAMVNSVSYGVWPAIGFCNHFQRTGAAGFISDSAANHLLGGSGNSIGYEARIGSVYLAGAPVYNAGAYPVGSIIGVAVDLDNKLVWFWNPVTGKWNGGTLATQNPSTRTGGFDFSGLAGGPYYPAIETNLYGVNTQFTANFGGTPFSQTIPTDYTPWAVNVTTVTTHTGYTIPPGGLIGATYRRVSAMTTETPAFVGWHRHDLGHGRLLTSLSVGPTGDGTLDTVDLVTTDGTNYFVEDFTQVFDEEDDLTVSWFVDGALVPDSAYEDNTATGIRFTGLNYFVGQSPTVVAFGLDLGPFVVDANGTIFVPYGSGTPPSSFDFTAPGAGAYIFTSAYVASHLLTEVGRNGGVAYSGGFIPIAVGFPFVSQGQILRAIAPEQAGTRSGPAFAKIRRAHEVQALLRSTMGIQFGTDFGTSMQMASLKSVSGVTPDPTQLYSGLWRETVNSAYDFDAMLAWQIVRPYPASVVSIGAAEQAQDS